MLNNNHEMSCKDLVSVITTINNPTECVIELVNILAQNGSLLIVIGDQKGPSEYCESKDVLLFRLEDQLHLKYKLVPLLLTGSYARKNIGYLLAISKGAKYIYETDDDNAPLKNWALRSQTVLAIKAPPEKWCNVYRFFTKEIIWPRGFPLEFIKGSLNDSKNSTGEKVSVNSPIQQGLVNISPDVDAIWRFIFNDSIIFNEGSSVWLPPGTWCPYNSQSTWWWPVAFPLMYLPSFCSFRMTDIWRSLIAQRCLWEVGMGIVFHGPEVYQSRNPHSIIKDYQDEVDGYIHNSEIANCLLSISLDSNINAVGDNLYRCYEALSSKGFIARKELKLVNAWLSDIGAVFRP